MQTQINFRNVAIFSIAGAFLYLSYLLWWDAEIRNLDASGVGDGFFPNVNIDLRDLISHAIMAAQIGGHAVVKVHDEKILMIKKKGKTKEGVDEFVTKADLISNQLIMETLSRFPGIKIISEEKPSAFSDDNLRRYRINMHKQWQSISTLVDQLPHRSHKLNTLVLWVDPLDATQEFTENLVEYVTTMVCIVADGQPIFGVIYRPFSNETTIGLNDFGLLSIPSRPNSTVKVSETKTVLVSRSHAGTIKKLMNRAMPEMVIEPAGGAGYKVLRLLNRTARIYIHTTALKKWDICAGDALLRSVKGAVIDLRHAGSIGNYGPYSSPTLEHGILAALDRPYSLYQKISSFLDFDAES